jgi:catechol 2,3-dioxygenase-like lactoylglutathione lyase family enzyme
MANPAKAVPTGFHTVTPTIVVNDAAKAIEFYKKAFGAQEISRFVGPDGKTIMHAEIRIGDSPVMLSDEMPDMNVRSPKAYNGPPPARLWLLPRQRRCGVEAGHRSGGPGAHGSERSVLG